MIGETVRQVRNSWENVSRLKKIYSQPYQLFVCVLKLGVLEKKRGFWLAVSWLAKADVFQQ